VEFNKKLIMLVVVALVVAQTLLEKRPLALDFICTDLESCTDEIFKNPLVALNSAKDINIKAGYDGSLNESYHKTSGLSLGGLVGIGSLYTSTEDLEGRIKKTAVNSTSP
jgi:hypothetical protein